VLPHDQKIGSNGDNSQPFLAIPSEILKAVHQEVFKTLVDRHENSEMDLAVPLNTRPVVAALGIWLSILPAQMLQTCPMSPRALPLTSEGVPAFHLFLSATATSQDSFLVILYSR